MKIRFWGVSILAFTSLIATGSFYPTQAFEESIRTVSVSSQAGQIIRQGNQETSELSRTMKQITRSQRGKFHGDRIERQFALYEFRLKAIAARIQSLIAKKKAEGKDVASAQQQWDASQTMLAKAVKDGKKAVDMFSALNVETWNTQRSEIKAAITQAQLARREFIQAQKLMLTAVKLLREI